MLKIRRQFARLFCTTLVIVGGIFTAQAQPGDPGDDPDNPVPIGGLEILLLAGGALGVKKIISSKKNN